MSTIKQSPLYYQKLAQSRCTKLENRTNHDKPSKNNQNNVEKFIKATSDINAGFNPNVKNHIPRSLALAGRVCCFRESDAK